MKATTVLLAFALIVAISSAQSTNVTAFGVNCTVDKSACSKINPMFCCANIVRSITFNTTNSTQQCVNQTIANKTV